MKTVEKHSEQLESESLDGYFEKDSKNLESESLDGYFEEDSEKLESNSLGKHSEQLESKSLDEHIKELKKKSLNNLSPYAILNLDEKASQKEIKDRYRELAKLTHPDRGEDELFFKAIGNAFRKLNKNKPEDENKNNDENNTEDEDVGLNLLSEGYAPYVSYRTFCNLNAPDKKKLAVLLGKQKRIYCNKLISKYDGIDLNAIATSTINFNSVDLDSAYLSPENQEKILALSQKAALSHHSLNGRKAITTEIVSLDDPTSYLAGWKLLHEKPGTDSGALQLFKTWRREQRKKLAIAIGNEKINHSGADLTWILDHHDPIKNTNLEADFNRWLNTSMASAAVSLIQNGQTSRPTQEDCEMELARRLDALPTLFIKDFVLKLKKFNTLKDDNEWYQVGIKSIKSPNSSLTESAFSFLSPGAQRHVAIELGKMSEDYSLGNPSIHKLICWANIKERSKNNGLEEGDLMCSNDSPEPSYQTENNQEKNTLDEEGLEAVLALALSRATPKALIFLESLFQLSLERSRFMLTDESQRTEPPVQASGASRIPMELSFLANLSKLSHKRSRLMITDESQSTEPPAQRIRKS